VQATSRFWSEAGKGGGDGPDHLLVAEEDVFHFFGGAAEVERDYGVDGIGADEGVVIFEEFYDFFTSLCDSDFRDILESGDSNAPAGVTEEGDNFWVGGIVGGFFTGAFVEAKIVIISAPEFGSGLKG